MVAEVHRVKNMICNNNYSAVKSMESQFPHNDNGNVNSEIHWERSRVGNPAPGTHSGNFAYLFMDTHVASMNPYATLAGTGYDVANSIAGTNVDSFRVRSRYWHPTGME
jgi:prepilin-type processing-associated H-X9-DG protein